MRRQSVRPSAAWGALLLGLLAPLLLHADDGESSTLPRHPLERQALLDPQGALQSIADELARTSSDDQRQQALLQLARANACRVIADWSCQRDAGRLAREAGSSIDDPILTVRGQIAEARAAMAMQDYGAGEQQLAAAGAILAVQPHPELAADVALGYSSLSHSLGKHAVAEEYARRGLEALDDPTVAQPMRVRLMRNQARALAQLGRRDEARELLQRASAAAQGFEDPKLSAELYLERARMARQDGDQAAQVENGQAVMQLGESLRNSQLLGLGHEVLGLAALDRDASAQAIEQLEAAYASFRSLQQGRDQLRVGRELLRLQLADRRGEPTTQLALELMALDEQVIAADRAQSAAEFQARLDYARQEIEVQRLASEAALAEQRNLRLSETERLSRWLAYATLASLLILMVFLIGQRLSNQRLRSTLRALQESRNRAREFLGLSSGLVCLHDAEGRIVELNPGAALALGVEAGDAVRHHLAEHVVATAEAELPRYLAALGRAPQLEGTLRVRRADGSHAHWRYASRWLGEDPQQRLVLMQAVDVTDHVQQTEELRSMALHDPLTGCFNRRYLSLFELQQRSEGWTAVVIDLDQFKAINDRHGHEHGDQVLRQFADFLRRHARSEDAIVRSGGDEFVILLPRPDREAGRLLLARLEADGSSASCRFSVGVAERQGTEGLNSTIDRADRSMYQHKAQRRSQRA